MKNTTHPPNEAPGRAESAFESTRKKVATVAERVTTRERLRRTIAEDQSYPAHLRLRALAALTPKTTPVGSTIANPVDLARHLGVSEPTARLVWNGRPVSVAVLGKIRAAFGLLADDFMEGWR